MIAKKGFTNSWLQLTLIMIVTILFFIVVIWMNKMSIGDFIEYIRKPALQYH